MGQILRLQMLCAAISLVLLALLGETVSSTSPQGIRAALFHRDHVSNPGAAETANLSDTERVHRNAKRSDLRARLLGSTGYTQDRPAENWESDLSDVAPYEYLMEISLGTPPQSFLAVADTGSDLTWLLCLPCEEGCDSNSHAFDPSLSSTYSGLSCSSPACEYLNETSTCPYVKELGQGNNSAAGCPFTYYYADNSESGGKLSSDSINLASVGSGSVEAVPNFWFGCSNIVTSDSGLLTSSSGLVGLGQGNVSFPRQLGHYYGDIFSYCLVDRLSATVDSSPLIFGEAALPSDPRQVVQWTPTQTNDVWPYFYYVGSEGITINGIPVDFSLTAVNLDGNGNGGIVFDSGTTYSSLVPEAFDALIAAMADQVTNYNRIDTESPYFKLCYTAKWSHWLAADDVPKISYHFLGNTSFDLSVQNSWIEYDSNTVCLAILESSDSRNISYFGNVQQTDFQIIYDRVKSNIGFFPTVCDSHS